MKRLFSFSVTSTFTFILSVLAILVIAVSAPTMVQAVLGPVPTLSGDVQSGNSIMASPYYEPKVNPAANFGSLTDNGTAAYMGIGISTPISPLHIYSTTSTQPETIDLDGAQPITAQWNDYCSTGGAFSGSGFLARFARGSKASPSNVTNGDRLGFNVFGGWVGGWFHTAAIEAIVDNGTVSGSSLPTYMRFSTTPSGSTSRVERMRISSSGNVGIGTTNPTHGLLDVETTSATGVYGSSGSGFGVYGSSNYDAGVFGYSSGSGFGVEGISSSNYGVVGNSDSSVGVIGQSSTGNGVVGSSNGTGYGVYGQNTSGNRNAGYFDGSVRITDNLTVSDNLTVGGRVGIGTPNPTYGRLEVYVVTDNATIAAVYGRNSNGNVGNSGAGVFGDSPLGWGTGVRGNSPFGLGVYGTSASGTGVYGQSTSGNAGYFSGNVYVNGTENVTGDLNVTGTLRKGAGSFMIDHPLDPENKYLQHSFVESPDMMNVYNGNIVMDEKGEAAVQLPSYFEALNRDFRYQLTCIGGAAVVYVAEEINGNHFKIAGGKPGLKVSWQVTGVRQDVYAKAHPIVVEQEKPANEKGLYLHPKEWGQPEEKGISAALNK